MKNAKFIVAGMIFCMTAFSSVAQQAGQLTAQERAASQTQKMNTELQMTEDQLRKAEEINLGIILKNDAVRSNQEMSDELKKESVQQNNLARKEAFRQILTAEQFVKFEQMENAKSVSRKELKPVGIEMKKTKPTE